MAKSKLPPGVHAVGRRTGEGKKWHFYAWRGGPKFWTDEAHYPSSREFLAAYTEATALPRAATYIVPNLVDDFLSSPEMPKGERTRADYRRWGLRLAEEFKDDPAEIFEDPGSRAEVNEWRKQWAHSPRQYDYAGTVAAVLLNWAVDQGKIRQHHCQRLRKVYEVDRAEIVWTPDHREAIEAKAPEWIRRILTAACETGLRVADLTKLAWSHVEATPHGRRIRVRTSKRKRVAYIPVTEAMGKLLDATPRDRMLILLSERGKPLTPHRASEGLRQWRDKAGLTPEALGYDLRLQDARGTAATRLLSAGLSLAEIAAHMGWSIRHAAAVIEHYARVSPDETDAILVKLATAKGSAS
ncbi:site-specific integrase [Cereibacter azotoformans]|uniref:tyrosine-type recombinase/integrase n=1 Tax=Cereibacter azotoformans TaxID=43057 RepID=UPI001EECE6B2|nr:site-specific integrase [Cereibacter azotoformans]ULB09554.1 site-specific integrase [Cereibacter azotoformans]